MQKKSYWKMTALCLIVILVMGIVSALVKTQAGNILIREVKVSTRGGSLSGMIYVPKEALENDGKGNYTNKRPVVILSHGYLNSNEMQDPNAIELSRRGYIVFSMDMYGHGNSDLPNTTDDPTGTGATLGALDAYNYVLTLPYADTTRIGFVAHSMGGMNTGNTVALTAGFYTLEDRLLNMLHDELGVEITAEEVAEQNPDLIADTLDDYSQGVYEIRKEEITEEYEIRPKAIVFMGSGPGFASMTQAHEVEVAGNSVWRDLQANVGVTIGIYEENAWLMFGARADGIDNSSQIPETSVAKSLFETGTDTVLRRQWYQINLSGSAEPAESTLLGAFEDINYASDGIEQAAMFVLVIPLAMLLLQTPFFAELKKKPVDPILSKRDKSFWIIAILLTVIPAITYIPFFMLGGAPTTYAGNKSFISWSAVFSQEMSTRVAVWSVLNAVIAGMILFIRYQVTVKKEGLSFKEYTGLDMSWNRCLKGFLLALAVFTFTYMTVVFSNFFFAYSDMRMWVIAARAMTPQQFIAWGCYFIFFLFYYVVNGVVINTGRMKDMPDKKNMIIMALINGAGMTMFIALNYVYMLIRGHLIWNDFGLDLFLSIAVIFPVMVILPVAACYSRKLYEKTGSVWTGARINAMIFTWIIIGNTCFHYSLIAKIML